VHSARTLRTNRSAVAFAWGLRRTSSLPPAAATSPAYPAPPHARTSCAGCCSAACASGACRATSTTDCRTTAAASPTSTPDRIEDTLDKLADAQPDADAETSAEARILAECDRKLANYRAALDAGTDPKIVTEWIAHVQAEKSLAEARPRQRGPSTKRLSREQIKYIVTTLTDITQVIHDADPRDKAEIYSQLGLRLTCHPGEAAVLVEARPAPASVCVRFVSEAGHETETQRGPCLSGTIRLT
jgi:hypothetical protein